MCPWLVNCQQKYYVSSLSEWKCVFFVQVYVCFISHTLRVGWGVDDWGSRECLGSWTSLFNWASYEQVLERENNTRLHNFSSGKNCTKLHSFDSTELEKPTSSRGFSDWNTSLWSLKMGRMEMQSISLTWWAWPGSWLHSEGGTWRRSWISRLRRKEWGNVGSCHHRVLEYGVWGMGYGVWSSGVWSTRVQVEIMKGYRDELKDQKEERKGHYSVLTHDTIPII